MGNGQGYPRLSLGSLVWHQGDKGIVEDALPPGTALPHPGHQEKAKGSFSMGGQGTGRLSLVLCPFGGVGRVVGPQFIGEGSFWVQKYRAAAAVLPPPATWLRTLLSLPVLKTMKKRELSILGTF